MSGERVRHGWLVALLSIVALLARCSCEGFGLDDVTFACTTDGDCAAGFVCDPSIGICSVSPAQPQADGGTCNPTEADEVTCGDQRDNDCDGRIDCEDPSCENRSCAENGALACRSGGCACAIAEVELDRDTAGAGSVLMLEDRLRFLYAGGDGGVFYGECEGACDAPSIIPLGGFGGAVFRPMVQAVGSRLIASWVNAGGALGYAECEGNCLDGGFRTATVTGVSASASSMEVVGHGSVRAMAVVSRNGQGVWVECSSGCDQPTATWSQVVLASGTQTRGAAAAMWEQDGVLHRRAAFGDPLLTTSCSGAACSSAMSWTTNLVLDSDAFQPELQVTPEGRTAVFARNEALKKLTVFVCAEAPGCHAPQAWHPVVAFAYPTGSREYDSSTTPDGRFAFVTFGGGDELAVGEEVAGRFSAAAVPLCDGGSVVARRPAGFPDHLGRWSMLYHHDRITRLYLPRP